MTTFAAAAAATAVAHPVMLVAAATAVAHHVMLVAAA